MVGELLRPVSCLLFVFALGACGPGVTLTLRGGSTLSGRPISNDDTSVEIQTSDGRYRVCKRDIVDADHAGNGAAIAGVLIAIAGTALAAATAPDANSDGFVDLSPLVAWGVGMAAGGALIGVGGLVQFIRSKSATGLPASGPLKKCKQPVWSAEP